MFKEAYSILGVINRCFLNKTKDILVPVYKSLVRSRLEYCVQAWRPYLVKDTELMEKVQKRMTRVLPDLKNMSYPERLKILGLTTLESRRLRGDLIEVFKVVKGFDNIDGNIFFFTETLEFVGGIVRNYISILLTWMFEN